ncbi:MAG TPA: hypothetical protein ACQGQH_08195 [Xylella sp.]
MQTRSLAYANYWRHSLADADTGRGALDTSNISTFRKLSQQQLASGCAGRDIVAACFDKEPEQIQTVEVVIRPKVYTLGLEHGTSKQTGTPAIVTPIVASALLARDGRIYPLTRTMIPRDLLEPLAQGHFSIGCVSDQDAFLSAHPVPDIAFVANDTEPSSDPAFDQQWADFLAGCDRLLEHIGCGWPSPKRDYTLAEYGYLAKEETVISRHILALYDHLHRHAPQAPLFERYTSTGMSPPEPCLPPHAGFSKQLAHASNVFPLTRTQCDALAHLMAAQAEEILAVNGPPGTGKTTLLLSAVASMWAHAALTDGAPPVIVAASATNQVVTNIIDAFGHDFATGDGPFAGRWLPNIKSFGAFLPAASKATEAAVKYQTEAFFNAVESTAYVAEAQQAYVCAATAAFPEIAHEPLSVQTTVKALQEAIRKEAATLTVIEEAWSALGDARAAVQVELGDTPAATMTQRRTSLDRTATEKQWIDDLVTHWERYRAQESLVYAFFPGYLLSPKSACGWPAYF